MTDKFIMYRVGIDWDMYEFNVNRLKKKIHALHLLFGDDVRLRISTGKNLHVIIRRRIEDENLYWNIRKMFCDDPKRLHIDSYRRERGLHAIDILFDEKHYPHENVEENFVQHEIQDYLKMK